MTAHSPYHTRPLRSEAQVLAEQARRDLDAATRAMLDANAALETAQSNYDTAFDRYLSADRAFTAAVDATFQAAAGEHGAPPDQVSLPRTPIRGGGL